MTTPSLILPQTFTLSDGGIVNVGMLSASYQIQYQPAPPVPCPPCPPVPAATVFGVDTDADVNVLASHLGIFPGMGGTRLFVSGGHGQPDLSPANKFLAALPPSCRPHYSYRDNDQGGVETMLESVYRPVDLTFWHEADRQNAGGIGPSGFQAGWKTLYTAWSQLPADKRAMINLPAVHTAYWTRQKGNDWRPWWPEGYATEMRFDHYNDNWTNLYMSAGAGQDVCIAAAQEAGVPYGLSETGSIRMANDPSGQGRLKWMVSNTMYAVAAGATVVNWWCAKPSANNPTWVYHLDVNGTTNNPELAYWQAMCGGNR